MAAREFELIARYFAGLTPAGADVSLGIGDDAAVVEPPAGQRVVVTTDTLVSGTHFLPTAAAVDIGHKALAVNLSDLAAMGADPRWFLLALTLPSPDEPWLAELARGLATLAGRHEVALIGGDTTRGALSLTITALGLLPAGVSPLRRDGARVGDRIYVSGTLGDAALALVGQQRREPAPREPAAASVQERLDRPTPRVGLGRGLRGLASAAIDVSDGLAADLGHILEASGVGASIAVDRLPLSTAFRTLDPGNWRLAVSGGDDYELCFTVPAERGAELRAVTAGLDMPVTWVGTIEAAPGLRWLGANGVEPPLRAGYSHFAGDP